MPITINGNGIITGASTLATPVGSPTFTTPNIDSAQFPTVSGTAPLYAARAWVNFNGTGTVAIRASGNVSSITDNGAGNYTVNFATAMPDVNYGFLGCANGLAANSLPCLVGQDSVSTKTTSALQILVSYNNNVSISLQDVAQVSVSVFR